MTERTDSPSKRGNKDVGDKIRLRRDELKMTRQALADELGVKYRYIAQLESGYRNASHKQQLALSRALGVGLDDLFNPDDLRDFSPNSTAEPALSSGSIGAGDAAPVAAASPSPSRRKTMREVVAAAAREITSLPRAVRVDALNQVQKIVVDSLTSGRIESLAHNEVFVFGSNADGIHDGGAARQAYDEFGAVWGQGHGHHGRSYAIDTMSGLSTLAAEVKTFLDYARQHPELRFRLAPIGTGVAGYRAHQIAPLFAEMPGNVVLPLEFRAVLDEES